MFNNKSWFITYVMLAVTSLIVMILYSQGINASASTKLIELSVSVDYMNKWFLYTIISISLFVMLFSKVYMEGYKKESLFYMMLFIFVFSMVILIVSKSPIIMFIGWEGLGVSSFILIISYHNKVGTMGGILTLMNNRVGDVLFLFCMSYWFILNKLGSHWLLIAMMFLFSITKSAQWPFINWLPSAMAAPTPISALVHSSTLVTAGIWLCLQFNLHSYKNVSFTMFLLSMWTLVLASISALIEMDFKKVIALSTLSQLGLMFLSFSLGGKLITYFHIIMHAYAKASLFIIAGSFISSSFSNQSYNSMWNSLSMIQMFSMVMSLLSLTSVMFLSGFYSKELIFMNWMFMWKGAFSMILIMALAGMTGSYCIKLGKILLVFNNKIMPSIKEFLMELSIFVMMMIVIMLGWVSIQTYIGLEVGILLYNSMLDIIVFISSVSLLLNVILKNNIFSFTYKTIIKMMSLFFMTSKHKFAAMNTLEAFYLSLSNSLLNFVFSKMSVVLYVMIFVTVVMV